MARPFSVIGFTVFFTAAILFDMKTGVTASVFGAFTVALVIALFSEKARSIKIIPVVAASGALACLLLLGAEKLIYQPAVEYDGKNCDIKAVLTSECEERYGNYYCEAKALTVNGEESGMKFRFTFSKPIEAEPYDIIEGKFSFFVLGSTDEEYLLSYKSKGMFLGAYTFSEKYEVVNIPEDEKPFAKKIIDFRASVKDAIYKILPDDRSSVAVALILGDKSRIPDDYIDNFNEIGIMHLVCVSGFHLSLWSFLILGILRKTKINQKIANLIAMAGVIAFMLIAGLSYSVIRSGIMMILYLFSDIVSKKHDPLNSLGFSLAAIALYNPFAMGSAGLQLSALATLGLILYSMFFGRRVRVFFEKIKPVFIGKVLYRISEGIFTTAAATAFILPVILRMNSAFHFGIFVANPIAIPLSQAAIILCSLGAVIGSLPLGIPNIPAFAGGLFVDLFIRLADGVSKLRFLSVRTDDETECIVLIGMAVIALVSVSVFGKRRRKYALTCALCAVYFTATMFISSGISERETRINVVDCGNGTSVIIRADGKNYLFGCGGTEFLSLVKLTEAVEHSGGELESIIIPDESEHNSDCFTEIISDFRPKSIWCSGLPDGTEFLTDSSEVKDFSSLDISGDVNIYGKETNGSRYAVFENKDISVLICFDPVDFEEIGGEFDVVISRNDYPYGITKNDCRTVVISAEKSRGRLLEKEISSKGIYPAVTGGEGNIIIRASDGAVTLKREN